jgi:hypothetical protein
MRASSFSGAFLRTASYSFISSSDISGVYCRRSFRYRATSRCLSTKRESEASPGISFSILAAASQEHSPASTNFTSEAEKVADFPFQPLTVTCFAVRVTFPSRVLPSSRRTRSARAGGAARSTARAAPARRLRGRSMDVSVGNDPASGHRS